MIYSYISIWSKVHNFIWKVLSSFFDWTICKKKKKKHFYCVNEHCMCFYMIVLLHCQQSFFCFQFSDSRQADVRCRHKKQSSRKIWSPVPQELYLSSGGTSALPSLWETAQRNAWEIHAFEHQEQVAGGRGGTLTAGSGGNGGVREGLREEVKEGRRLSDSHGQ